MALIGNTMQCRPRPSYFSETSSRVPSDHDGRMLSISALLILGAPSLTPWHADHDGNTSVLTDIIVPILSKYLYNPPSKLRLINTTSISSKRA